MYLGMCNNDEEKTTMHRIAASLDGRDEGQLVRGDGLVFQVPLDLREEGEGRSVEDKRKWLAETVREVYKSFTDAKATYPASHHPCEDAAEFISFLENFLLRSPSQETRGSDVVPGVEDVYNGAATLNELCMGENCAVQESASVDWARMTSFLLAQQGMRNLDVAIPVGVNFGIEESKFNVFAMMLISCKDEEIQDLKQKNQKKKQKMQEEKQKNEELQQRLQERDNRIARLKRENELLTALTGVDPQMKEFDLDGLA